MTEKKQSTGLTLIKKPAGFTLTGVRWAGQKEKRQSTGHISVQTVGCAPDGFSWEKEPQTPTEMLQNIGAISEETDGCVPDGYS